MKETVQVTQSARDAAKPTGPDRIYLQPECGIDWSDNGRQWCEDDVWEECGEPGCECNSVRYIREDLARLSATSAPAGVEGLLGALSSIAEPLEGFPVGDPWAFYADLQKVASDALEAYAAAPAPSGQEMAGEVPTVTDHDAYRLRKVAEADCGCRIPAPFDEVADHLATVAFDEGVKRATATSPSASGVTVPGGGVERLAERIRAAVTYQYMPMAVRRLLSEAAAALSTPSASTAATVEPTAPGEVQDRWTFSGVMAEMLAVATASLDEGSDLADEWPIDCRADVDRWQAVIGQHATATPGALDPATVERCAQVANAEAARNAAIHCDWKRTNEVRNSAWNQAVAADRVAAAIRALATDPHQHGAGNGGKGHE